jgi:chromosome segregation ATPase
LDFESAGKQSAENMKSIKKLIAKLDAEIKKLSAQLSKVHDAFEQGTYNVAQFLERSQNISERVKIAEAELAELNSIYKNETKRAQGLKEIVPKATQLVDAYDKLPTAKEKNDMLKQVLEKCVYIKEKSGMYKGVSADCFELMLYPRIYEIN